MKDWLLNLIKKFQSKVIVDSETCKEKSESKSEEIENHSMPSMDIRVSITTRYVDEEDVGELSHLDFGKPAGVMGCFLNYEPSVLCPPTEKQINYLKNLGVVIPDGITKEDASCMISRATGEDSLESPSPEMVDLATGFNLEFSAFIGEFNLFSYIIKGTGKRNRAALYAYAVRQSMRGASFGNMLEDSELEMFYAFADQILEDSSLMKSLLDRNTDDYIKPYRGTSIYKAAATFFDTKK